jgi:LmbE family N-acetylglucosaminyl deacetylase
VLVLGDGLSSALSSVLCIGAHSDDIEIGCGGTVLKLVAANSDLAVRWVVLSADGARADEARASAERFLDGAAKVDVEVLTFRERYFPHLAELKEFFDDLGSRVRPDIVLTHHQGDVHQDHRATAELTWNTFRDHLILEYEIPKYDGDLGRPNAFVGLDEETAHAKTKAIVEGFPSQAERYWFTAETFLALMRLRGIEARAPSGFAEAFHAKKIALL